MDNSSDAPKTRIILGDMEGHRSAGEIASSPFVGRAPELERIGRALADAATGRGAAVVIEGEAGVGIALARDAHARGSWWLGAGPALPSGSNEFGFGARIVTL